MNYNRLILFLLLGSFFAIKSMDKKEDYVDWNKMLDQAVQSRDAQRTTFCLLKGADPCVLTSCGEHKYLIDLLDSYWNFWSASSTCDEITLLGMNLGVSRQNTFDNYIYPDAKAVMYVFMKAGARNFVCKKPDGGYCPDDGFKKNYRKWFYEKMEQLERQIDQLKEDCYYGRVEGIARAVAHKVPLSVPDVYGNTLLHDAFARNHSQIIKTLLVYDQSLLTVKNNEGKLPTEMAPKR